MRRGMRMYYYIIIEQNTKAYYIFVDRYEDIVLHTRYKK